MIVCEACGHEADCEECEGEGFLKAPYIGEILLTTKVDGCTVLWMDERVKLPVGVRERLSFEFDTVDGG